MSNSNQSKPAIVVKGLTKTFKTPLDKSRSVKSKILGKAGKGYREFTPLDDVSFTIYKGDFFGIVGRNGSGKSTLLKTIAGIYEPTAGKVEVNGTLVPFIELGVGFNPNLTGRENVYLNAALLGFSRSEIDDMYDDIVDFAELHDFMEERLQNYSSGMQVRLAFSISIRAKGDILLLDEVLAVGDKAFQQKCYDYFDQLKKEKRTVILVTHSMANIERFCNRALLLKDGRIDTIGSSDEVSIKYRELFDIKAKQPNKLQDTARNGRLNSLIVAQGGESLDVIVQGVPFSVVVDIELLNNQQYRKHNLTIYLRNKHDLMLACLSTRGILDTFFEVGDNKINADFCVDDNIFAPGEYYIDVLLKSENTENMTREVVLEAKKAKLFSIKNEADTVAASLTMPEVKVTLGS